MRFRLISISALFFFATVVFAKDVYLSIGGSVGVFHTDTRIFNPSTTKDIQVQAYLLPAGNQDNSSVQPITITVPKRQMLDYNDVLQSLFNSSTPLAAIRLKSDDDFIATQRIYAQQSASSCITNPGTLGQFVPGLDTSAAKKQGVLIQLKSSDKFRTNIGLVSPNAAVANVTWRLYDKSNAVVGSVSSTANMSMIQPFGVISPTNVNTLFSAPGADLSDAWVSFVSDQPLLAYASVIDNATTDPTFIPMSEDTGVPPTAKTFNVTVQNFSITISPAPNTLKVGDQVIFHITVSGSNHGFELDDPSRSAVIPGEIFSPGTIVDKTFTVPSQGTYTYFCTNTGCGAHPGMTGSFDVGNPTNDPGPHY